MSQATMSLNLDLLCASNGFEIAAEVIEAVLGASQKEPDDAKRHEKAAKSAENLITRALGVLQGQGVYAMFLYLEAKKETGYVPLRDRCVALIDKVTGNQPGRQGSLLQELCKEQSVLANLPTLLLVKRTMEQALTYARYHAKAAGVKAGDGNGK